MAFRKCDLFFREVELNDLTLLRQWRNDPEMAQGWHDPRSVQTPEQQLVWYRTLDVNNQAYLAVDEGDRIGFLRFRLDPINRRAALTGTDVAPGQQRKGYGKRILRAGAEYVLRDLGYHRVTAEALELNIAATHIILASGFKHEGCYRSYVWRDGRWQNWHFYSLLEGEL